MQNKKFHLLTVSALIISLMLSPLAEAKRLGGGGSRGMSRSYPSQSYQRNNNNYQPQRSYQPQPQRQQPQQNGSGVGRMVGAGVAGAAIGALAGHAMANNNNNTQAQSASAAAQGNQQPVSSRGSMMNWILLIILVLGGLFLYRRFRNKNQNPSDPMQQHDFTHFAGNTLNQNHNSNSTNVFGQRVNAAQSSAPTLADGSNCDVFLRFARQRFNHVQAMNMGANLEEIRRYFTPEMFNSIKEDIAHNQETAEFSNLQTELVDSTRENGQYIASIRFSGLVSEDIGSAATPFSEVWHFVKPADSQQDWLIAGIQQD